MNQENDSSERLNIDELAATIDADLRTIVEAAVALIAKRNKEYSELAEGDKDYSGTISFGAMLDKKYEGITGVIKFVTELKKNLPELLESKEAVDDADQSLADQPEAKPISVKGHIHFVKPGLLAVSQIFADNKPEVAQLATKTLNNIDKLVTSR